MRTFLVILMATSAWAGSISGNVYYQGEPIEPPAHMYVYDQNLQGYGETYTEDGYYYIGIKPTQLLSFLMEIACHNLYYFIPFIEIIEYSGGNYTVDFYIDCDTTIEGLSIGKIKVVYR